MEQGPAERSTGEYKFEHGDLPWVEYEHPDGSKERFESYGEYFSAVWSANLESTTGSVISKLEEVFPEGIQGLIDFTVDHRTVDSLHLWDAEKANKLVGDNWHYVRLDAYMGTFFCERDEDGKIEAGVLAPNDIRNEEVVKWQDVTASPAILQRKSFIAENLPAGRYTDEEAATFLAEQAAGVTLQ